MHNQQRFEFDDIGWTTVGPDMADCRLLPVWLSPEQNTRLLSRLLAELSLEQASLKIYGRWVKTPRLTGWYGDPEAKYRYSGVRHEPQGWTATLSEMRSKLQEATGHAFNSVLVNYYRDGADSMGWHSDDEPELGPQPVVASVSLGGERKMKFRHRQNQASRFDVVLPGGSLLVMQGRSQQDWQHSIAKTAKPCAPRMNLTFRQINPTEDTRF